VRLTFHNEREVTSDLRSRQRVGGNTLVLALVTELHGGNHQLLAETRVVVLTWHCMIKTPP